MKNIYRVSIISIFSSLMTLFMISSALGDGSVNVSLSNDEEKIRIIGDDLPNCIKIKNWANYLLIDGRVCEDTGIGTVVTPEYISMEGVAQIIVRMNGGDDEVRIEEIDTPDIDWKVTGNEGSDSISIEAWGHVDEGGVWVEDPALVSHSFSVKGGSNDDTILFKGVVYTENPSEVNGGAGHDTLVFLENGAINPTEEMGIGLPYYSVSLDINRFESVFWGCFRGDTLIDTESGLRPIRTIEPGDRVWSWDEATGQKVLRRVSRAIRMPAFGLRTLQVDQETIYTTDGHPFWVEGKGWVKARFLNTGDTLRSDSGTSLTVSSNRRVNVQKFYAGYDVAKERAALQSTEQRGGLRPAAFQPSELFKEGFGAKGLVYNIEVEDTHTFFVGKHKVLVHNK